MIDQGELSKRVSPYLPQTNSSKEGRERLVPIFPRQYPCCTSEFAVTVHSWWGHSPFILPCCDSVQGLRVTTNHAIPNSPRREVASMRRRTKARSQNRSAAIDVLLTTSFAGTAPSLACLSTRRW